MKIAFFLAEFPVLSETFVIRQIVGMVEAGHDVSIVTAQVGEKNLDHAKYREARLGERIVPLRRELVGKSAKLAAVLRFFAMSPFSAAGRQALCAALRAVATGCPAALLDIAAQSRYGSAGKFDAVIAHFGQVGVRAMYLQQAGLIQGPIATVFHGFDISREAVVKRNLGNYRRLFIHTAMLLPISHLWEKKLLAWGAAREKVQVLRMGVDLDLLTMQQAERPLSSPLKVLSVARFTEKKGLRYAIDGVKQAGAAIDYSIIGAGPLNDVLQSQATDFQGGRITFLGKQPQSAVFTALENADVFLLPSITAADGDMEGVPVVLMEAMAKGVLVLATRHSGIPELVQDGVSGLLVEERDAAAIAGLLNKLASGAIDIAALRLQARRAVEQTFDNRRLDAELVAICQALKQNGLTHAAMQSAPARMTNADKPGQF